MNNPFDRKWPLLAKHSPTEGKCTVLTRYYYTLSNAPDLLAEDDALGRIIVIAGKARTGGKSVYSHRLLHELADNKRTPIDLLSGKEVNSAGEGKKSCFSRIVNRVNFEGLFKEPDADIRILDERFDWDLQNRNFARQLGSNGLVIRMPRLDPTLKIPDIAADIKRYAVSASLLEHSTYLYEYSYVDINEWRMLIQYLNDAIDDIQLVETPLLLVEDAERFIHERIEKYPDTVNALNWPDTIKFLKAQERKPGAGLEVNLSDLNWVMFRAFEESGTQNDAQVPIWRIAFYYAQLGFLNKSDGAM